MEEFKEDLIYIILVIINFVLIFALMKYSYKIIDFNYIIAFAYAAAGILIFLFMKYIIKKILLNSGLIIITIFFLTYYFYSNRFQIINRLVNDYNIINNNMIENTAINFKHFYAVFFLIVPLIIISLYLSNKGLIISIPVLTLSLILFLWYTGHTKEIIKYLYIYIFLNIFSLVSINYVKNRKIFRKKNVKIRTSIFNLLISGIIISLITAAIVAVLPKEYNGRLNSNSYSYFKNKYAKEVKEVKAENKYNISYSGYNDSSSILGGPVKIDHSEALKVYGGNFLYLRGNVKEYYTGSSWLSENNLYIEGNINQFSNKEVNNSSIMSIRIKPVNLKTSTVFSPPYSIKVENNNKRVLIDKYGCFLREEPYDSEYSLEYYYNIKTLDDYKNLKVSHNQEDYFNWTNYLQVPPIVPQNVYDLVNNIIRKANAVTDFEKVKCLKEYLEKNYKYTLNTKELPQGEDFVYNFLFNEKQGYCTYFATALAIMCRIAEVPAVYVEGFKQSGNSIVTNDMAHAWVEVNLTRDNMWIIADASPSAYEESINSENKPKENTNINMPVIDKNKNADNNPQQEGTSNIKNVRDSKFYLVSILFCLLIILLMKNFYIIVRRNHLVKSKSVISLTFYSFKMLKCLGINISDSEGFLEFSQRIEDAELKDAMVLLSESYYKETYGNKKSEIDKDYIYKLMENKIKKKKGLIKYYLFKIIK